jgi:hypothetical protein
MGIPVKKSRSIEVDRVRFRFMIKDGPVTPNPSDREIFLTVQEDTDAPGRVLHVALPHGHEVTPETVRKLVRQALSSGWAPSARGGVFNLVDYSLP